MTVERNMLPGAPSAPLIASVRRILKPKGIRPPKCTYDPAYKLWYATWQWAEAIAQRFDPFLVVKPSLRKRCRWPHANEIASQYLLLVLAEMRNEHDLRLPLRAMEYLTPYVAQQLGAEPAKQLDGKPLKAIGVRLDLFGEDDDAIQDLANMDAQGNGPGRNDASGGRDVR